MRKSVKVVVIAAMLFFGYSAHAQIFGIRGGLGLATITSPNEFDNARFGSTFGTRVGATLEFELIDETLFLGTGLGFSLKGASTIGDNISFFYVESPVTVKYHIFDIGRSNAFYATSGFNLAVLAFGSDEGDPIEIGNQIGDEVKALDLGYQIGAGVIFDNRFEVGLLSEFGLLDISASDGDTLRNLTFMVSFAFKFGQ
ncbi:MAG: outer membrane beta-barrel protein [Pricia sp.]